MYMYLRLFGYNFTFIYSDIMLVVNFSTGLSIVLQFLRNIFPVADETTSTQESLDWIEEAIIVILEFLRGVMEK